MPDHDPPCLLVCSGKDCRREPGFDDLMRVAAQLRNSAEVPCQGLCHGPIVGVVTPSGVRWVSRVRTRAARQRVVTAVGRGKLGHALREREVRSRRGVVRGANRARFLRSGQPVRVAR